MSEQQRIVGGTIEFKVNYMSPDLFTAVVNMKKEPFDVYIGRAGQGLSGYFGNPHRIGQCGLCHRTHDRTDAIRAYKDYFFKRVASDAIFKQKVLELRGKRLGCFCKPNACHGDVIIDWLMTQPE